MVLEKPCLLSCTTQWTKGCSRYGYGLENTAPTPCGAGFRPKLDVFDQLLNLKFVNSYESLSGVFGSLVPTCSLGPKSRSCARSLWEVVQGLGCRISEIGFWRVWSAADYHTSKRIKPAQAPSPAKQSDLIEA